MAIRPDMGAAVFAPQRKVQRTPVNTLDKCTIVSTFPRKIIEIKETIFPGKFEIPAAPANGFSLLVVGQSSFFREEVDISAPLLEIPTGSIVMAKSIIRDWANGLVGCNMGDRMPGLFYVQGAWNEITVLESRDENDKSFGTLLAEARTRQKNWFLELVRIADTDWARTNQNPRSISDDSRLAAEVLQLQKTWMQDFVAAAKINCKACGELINPEYPVCRYCHAVVDSKKVGELGIVFAK